MKKILFLLLATALFAGCAKSILLQSTFVKSLNSGIPEKSKYLLFKKTYKTTNSGEVLITTRKVFMIGIDNSYPIDLLTTHDSSIEKLINFNARLIQDDSNYDFDLDNLSTYNLSSSEYISENRVKLLSLTREIVPGSLIETVSIHNFTLPGIGVSFTPQSLNSDLDRTELEFIVPNNTSIHYKSFNQELIPQIKTSALEKSIKFLWSNYSFVKSKNKYCKKNHYPYISVTLPTKNNNLTANTKWIEFGDWYLTLINKRIKTNSELKKLAQKIIHNKNSNLDKLNSILNYCQKNFRYEMVYLEKGELIPNTIETILQNKYGDCKDYSLLIHLLAKSVGIKTELALCHRGRGIQFNPEIPINQFNHVIVHYETGGKHYWFDGTNRTGIPGITTTDLINQEALVIKKNNSELIKIVENEKNELNIKASLHAQKNSVIGKIQLSLSHQYAIDFFYYDYFTNKKDMTEIIGKWLKKNISEKMVCNSIRWAKSENSFLITADVYISNAISTVEDYSYVSASKIFNKLIHKISDSDIRNDFYFYDSFGKISADLEINNLINLSNNKNLSTPFKLSFNTNFNIGPFNTKLEREKFVKEYKDILKKYNQIYKLKKS